LRPRFQNSTLRYCNFKSQIKVAENLQVNIPFYKPFSQTGLLYHELADGSGTRPLKLRLLQTVQVKFTVKINLHPLIIVKRPYFFFPRGPFLEISANLPGPISIIAGMVLGIIKIFKLSILKANKN